MIADRVGDRVGSRGILRPPCFYCLFVLLSPPVFVVFVFVCLVPFAGGRVLVFVFVYVVLCWFCCFFVCVCVV